MSLRRDPIEHFFLREWEEVCLAPSVPRFLSLGKRENIVQPNQPLYDLSKAKLAKAVEPAPRIAPQVPGKCPRPKPPQPAPQGKPQNKPEDEWLYEHRKWTVEVTFLDGSKLSGVLRKIRHFTFVLLHEDGTSTLVMKQAVKHVHAVRSRHSATGSAPGAKET